MKSIPKGFNPEVRGLLVSILESIPEYFNPEVETLVLTGVKNIENFYPKAKYIILNKNVPVPPGFIPIEYESFEEASDEYLFLSDDEQIYSVEIYPHQPSLF